MSPNASTLRANPPPMLDQTPLSPQPGASTPGQFWAIVLAGGEGVRLRPLIRHLYGEDRPKQYATLIGTRSLVRHTLDRVALTVPCAHTVVVTLQAHARYMAAEFAGKSTCRVLVQPEDRGTAAGVLLPAYWISWRDAAATIAVFPSDHFILEEAAFMAHVMNVAGFVERHPDWLVLLGAPPTRPETEYGWIEPGDRLVGAATEPIYPVKEFREKPSEAMAWDCFTSGWLWNTFVFVAKVATLLELGHRFLRRLSVRLARIAPCAGTADEPRAIQQAYALAPSASFSRAVLEACPTFLAVSRMPAITWSDWGTPERVSHSLREARIVPRRDSPSYRIAGEPADEALKV